MPNPISRIKALNPATQYLWRSEAETISNVRLAVRLHLPHTMQRIEAVERGEIRDPHTIEAVRDEVYALDTGHFRQWKQGRMFTRDFRFFNTSFPKIMVASFPKLELSPYGFVTRWDKLDYKEACEAVRFRLFKYRPELKGSNDKEKFYALVSVDLHQAKLGSLINGRGTKHFPERTVPGILTRVFPELHLDPKLFRGRVYDDIYQAEATVRSEIFRKHPRLAQLYREIARAIDLRHPSSERDLTEAKKIVTSITYEEFMGMRLKYFINRKKFPGFKGSFRQVLLRSFFKLDLKEEDLYHTYRWRNPEEARSNIRDTVLDQMNGLRRQYNLLKNQRMAGRKTSALSSYLVGIPLLTVSHRVLEKMGISMAGAGPKQYFACSIVRAMDESFPGIDLKALRREFSEQGYDLKGSARVAKLISRFERIAEGKREISAKDREFLEWLAGEGIMAEPGLGSVLIPRILLIRILQIHSLAAPKLLQMLA